MARPKEERGGGTTVKPTPKAPRPVVIAPTGRPPARPSYAAPKPAPVRSSSSAKTSKTSSAKAPAKKAADPYAKAQAAANARADAERNKAANRYVTQAKNLEAQAAALKSALNKDLKKGLLSQLEDINESRKQQGAVIREGFRERMVQLRGSAADNDKAAAQQSGINALNEIRERNSAVGAAMAQGAGESDVLQAQLMSLRNWNANQTEVNRGYYDTLRSIQSAQTDLNVDTRTALVNNFVQANADKEQLWTNYYNQRSELYTQLGNTRGQQADYFAMANEMRTGSGGAAGKAKASAKASAGAKPGAKQTTSKAPPKSAGAKAEAGKGVKAKATALSAAKKAAPSNKKETRR